MNNKFTFLTVLLISFFGLNAQINQATFSVGAGADQIDLTVTVNSNTNMVDFEMIGPATKWFGIGFDASSMSSGSYGILSNVNGGNPQEYFIQGQNAPSLQSSQDLTNISSSTSNGRTKYNFSRALTTSDAQDYVFPISSASINIIWAYGNSTTLAYHSTRGFGSLSFSNPCNIPLTALSDINICSGDSAMIFGNYYSQSGIFYDTLQTSIGCDSILSQELIVGNIVVTNLPDTNICFGDTIEVFGQNIFQSGTYTDTLNSATSACDSVVSLKVNVGQQIDTSVVNSGNQLSANQLADSFQWYDCSTNQAISSATAQTFTPTQSGLYKVEIFIDNCSEISSCYQILIDGLNEVTESNFRITPNPASDFIILNNINQNTEYEIEVYNMQSKLVLSKKINSNSNNINIEKLNSGVYIIVLKNLNQGEIFNSKLIKL